MRETGGGDPGRLTQCNLISFPYHSSQLLVGLTEKKECEVNAKGRGGKINIDFEPKKGVREGAIMPILTEVTVPKKLKKINK